MMIRTLCLLLCAFAVTSCMGMGGGAALEELAGERGRLEHLTAGDFFIQMADTQLGFAPTPLIVQLAGFSWGDDPTAREIEMFELAVEHANRLRPAFVVICGDLINRPGHPGQIAEFQRIAARLEESIPLYLVAGNHDVHGAPTAESLRSYRETFGPDWYSFRNVDVFGIVLNSSLFFDPGFVQQEADAQLDWLRSELEIAKASGARHLLVFQHHSFFVADPEEPDDYFNIPLARRAEPLALFEAAGVEAVLAGHYHRNATARSGELEMITTGPVGTPLGDDPSGFRIVRVGADRIEHHYFGIAEEP